MSNTKQHLAMTAAKIHATDKSSKVMTHPLGGFRVFNTERLTVIDYSDNGAVITEDSLGTKAVRQFAHIEGLRSAWKKSLSCGYNPLKS